MFYQTYCPSSHHQCALPSLRHPPAAMEWSCLLLHDVICSVWHMAHALQCTVNGDDTAVFPVLSLVTLTFDLDIQTRPSKGPNVSSLYIWHKSV